MNLLLIVILLTTTTAFAFVKKPNTTIKPHPLSANFKKGPVFVYTTLSPEARKRNHSLFPQKVTKYVVTPYTVAPYAVKKREDRNLHRKLASMMKTKPYETTHKYHHLRNKPMDRTFSLKLKALNEELLRDGVPQISIGISSEEVNTETNENIEEDFNQELLNDMQITDKFDDEIDPYEGTLRIKSSKQPTKDFYADSIKGRHPTKYAIKDTYARKGEKINPNDKIITRQSIVNMTMDEKPDNDTIVTSTTQEPEPDAPAPKFDYLRPKRHSKYYAQDIDELNKDMEELIFINRYDNEINVDEVKQKDVDSMKLEKWFRKAI